MIQPNFRAYLESIVIEGATTNQTQGLVLQMRNILSSWMTCVVDNEV
jgi:hypothetical protein